jgi:hypothetical protein
VGAINVEIKVIVLKRPGVPPMRRSTVGVNEDGIVKMCSDVRNRTESKDVTASVLLLWILTVVEG